jgi:hypothetical protein
VSYLKRGLIRDTVSSELLIEDINTYHYRLIPEWVAEASQIFLRDAHFFQNDLAMRNTADVAGGKPITVRLQSISDVSANNHLFAFYDIHGRKREVSFFSSVPDTTRDFFPKHTHSVTTVLAKCRV